MKLRAVFQRKEYDYDAVENCEVSRVVELPNGQFDYFIGHLLDDQDFLIELRSEMGYIRGQCPTLPFGTSRRR